MSLSVNCMRNMAARIDAARVEAVHDGLARVDASISDIEGALAAIRELIALKERQTKPAHSCEIPGCASCGNPPDRYDDFDEDLQALMDRDMEG